MNSSAVLASANILTDLFYSWAGQALFWGTLLAVVTWAMIRGPARRLSPTVHVALWTVVLIKFLIPTGPSATFSLQSLGTAILAPVASLTTTQAPIIENLPDLSGAIEEGSPKTEAANSGLGSTSGELLQFLAMAYIATVILFGTIRWSRYRRLILESRSLPVADDAVLEKVATLSRRSDLSRPPVVRITERDSSPFIFGVIHPTLVLPRCSLKEPIALEAILLHEIAHLRRGDMMVRALQWLVGTCLFFWPVVAWVNRRIDLARETTCDEWALRHGRLDAGEYARCLLRFAKPHRSGSSAAVACSMAANPQNVERRIDMILDRSLRARLRPGVGFLSIGIVAAWTLVSLTSASSAVVHEPDGDSPNVAKFGKLHRIHETHDGGGSEKFAASHPEADVDGDGVASPMEQHAFFIALALVDPEMVLDEFPHLDLNEDGELTAAELIDGMHGKHVAKVRRIRPDHHDGDEKEIIVQKITEGKLKFRQHPDEHDANHNMQFGTTEDGNIVVRKPMHAKKMAHWLVQNIDGTPDVDDVAEIVNTLTEIKSKHMMQLHPEADFDGDGTISEIEIKHFKLMQSEEMRAKLLSLHPEIDTDEDGVVSDEEMADFKILMHKKSGNHSFGHLKRQPKEAHVHHDDH